MYDISCFLSNVVNTCISTMRFASMFVNVIYCWLNAKFLKDLCFARVNSVRPISIHIGLHKTRLYSLLRDSLYVFANQRNIFVDWLFVFLSLQFFTQMFFDASESHFYSCIVQTMFAREIILTIQLLYDLSKID